MYTCVCVRVYIYIYIYIYTYIVGRPLRRWAHEIEACAGGAWTVAAKDQALWSALEDGFVKAL